MNRTDHYSLRLQRQAGFSLIEVLVAVTIIALMTGAVGYAVFEFFGEAQRDKATTEIEVFKGAVMMYKMKQGKVPNESDWPRCLLEPKAYVDKDKVTDGQLLDPWGNPYIYEKRGSEFEIKSLGADGIPGGEGENADVSSKKQRQ